MNTELLLKVKAAILARPEHFDMADWCQVNGEVDLEPRAFSQMAPPCGTTCCIGGWAVAIVNESPYSSRLRMWQGDRALELTERQVEKLFFSDGWDMPYASHYRDADTPAQRARVAASYIDYFIAQQSGDTTQ